MEKLAKRIKVYGRVQGVGFRPSVCRLAAEYSLQGFVRNLDGIVEIAVAGEQGALRGFIHGLKNLPAPAAVVRLEEETLGLREFEGLLRQNCSGQEAGFVAVSSSGQGAQGAVLPADIGICPTCLAELENKQNRRYRYPYISCPQCGPRYTIIRQLPYDRARTSMDEFALCGDCSKEYHDMQHRRGHAETISCFKCGPQLVGYTKEFNLPLTTAEALKTAQELLLAGKIIMVKAIGGYNLVCRADCVAVVRQLRKLKKRPTKPLAVLCADVETVRQFCEVNGEEECVLCSATRPIVLLRQKQGVEGGFVPNVNPDCPEVGVFLPPMGLYRELCEIKKPLVVTSCNFSGSPIIYDDDEAESFYRQEALVAGLFTYHRDILRPADDSLVKVISKVPEQFAVQVLRRTKGYMPEPVLLGDEFSTEDTQRVLAVGAQMEPGFCFTTGQKLYTAQIPGELEEERTEKLYSASIKDWQELLQLRPQLLVGDLHPNYTSTVLGQVLAQKLGVKLLQVQHHHAHALSVMAECGLREKVLAVCFDGTGYGSDGSIWGGEFLLCEGKEFLRVAHLEPISMLGGDISMKQAWKSKLCYVQDCLDKLHNGGTSAELFLRGLLEQDERGDLVKVALKQKLNTLLNSSMGRLFDAIAAALGIADYNSHQGHCAQALEKQATIALQQRLDPLQMAFTALEQENTLKWSSLELWQEVAVCAVEIQKLQKSGLSTAATQMTILQQRAALGFHLAVVEMITATVRKISAQHAVQDIALCGGCFANRILLEQSLAQLTELGFKVHFNQQVPPGDGGIALGQAYYGLLQNKS